MLRRSGLARERVRETCAGLTTAFVGKRAPTAVGVSAVGLRRQAQIGLHCAIALGKATLDLFLVLERRHDHHFVSVLPVGRGGHLVVVGELQRIDYPQDFVEVAPGAGRVGDGQANLLVRVDDEQRAYGQGVVGIGVDQVIDCLLYTSPSPRD